MAVATAPSAPPSPAGPAEPGDLERLPGPPRVPLSRVLQVLRFNQRQIEFVFHARRKLGEVFRMSGIVAGQPVVTSHPDHVRSLFTAKVPLVPSLTGESPLRPIVGGNSVLTAQGERHMRQRELLLPAFHGEAIERCRLDLAVRPGRRAPQPRQRRAGRPHPRRPRAPRPAHLRGHRQAPPRRRPGRARRHPLAAAAGPDRGRRGADRRRAARRAPDPRPRRPRDDGEPARLDLGAARAHAGRLRPARRGGARRRRGQGRRDRGHDHRGHALTPGHPDGRPPRDGALAISILLVHHREDVYPEPFAFRPERWDGHKPGTYEWIPFGGGTRRCLGAALAMAEQRVVLEAMARRLDLDAADPQPEHAVHRNVTMIPAHGATVVAHARR